MIKGLFPFYQAVNNATIIRWHSFHRERVLSGNETLNIDETASGAQYAAGAVCNK
ncbi:hypothetical protein [Oceanobacillus sp. J11TS1]|uniref:hypothetical protein n=1 Tax=Oceanobacillus sp. J11TS1 TaxID=2807191 RepID=UPI001B1A1ABC|nr:hypothetical protein [Oceanobacillus sp. J11TS1]GIO23771.1 hypothetical protein J11TS1_23520 [Oceanobacillus sp. J11TS1]